MISTARFSSSSDQSDFVYPVVRINYIPRILACAFLVMISYSELGNRLFSLDYSWIILTGGLWPHVARNLSSRAIDGKRQEIINMHIDAAFCALICLLFPIYYFVVTIVAVLSANALFIGFFRLLLSTFAVFTLTALVGYWLVQPHEWIAASPLSIQMTTLFMFTYFSTYGGLGYYLTRQMILLHKQVESLSLTDPLTQCYNRLFLDQNLTKELHRCYRVRYPLTLIFADLDYFKKINDEHGHAAGDEILKQFVSLARDSIRDDVDWIARFGGEEFVIVLPNSNAHNGSLVAERIRASLNAQTFSVNQTEIRVTCSFGVSSVNLDGRKPEAGTLLAQADDGLYQAKAKGRNRVETIAVNPQADKEGVCSTLPENGLLPHCQA